MGFNGSKSFLQRWQSSRGFPATAAFVWSLLACSLAAAPAPTSGKPSSYPSWWFELEVISQVAPAVAAPVWPDNYPAPDDFAAANVGQLKQIATAAYDELYAWLPNGAGPALDTLVKGWFLTDANGNFIPDANGKRQPRVTTQTDDFAVLNLGQLKAVAKPFYDCLISIHYQTAYPWANGTADDFAAVNLGQLKNVFSFGPDTDSDGDGIPDWWENLYGLNPNDPSDANQISQAGVLTNLYKYQNGLNPTKTDTDGDGTPDDQDIDPLDPNLNQPRVPETQYAVIDLATLGFINPEGMNDSLQILDGLPPPDGTTEQHCRLWTNGQFTDIPYPSDDYDGFEWYGPYQTGTVFLEGEPYGVSNPPIYSWNPQSGPGTLDFHLRADATAAGLTTVLALSGASLGGLLIGEFSASDGTMVYDLDLLWGPNGGPPTVLSDLLSTGDDDFGVLAINDSGLMAVETDSNQIATYSIRQYSLLTGQFESGPTPLPRLAGATATSPRFFPGINDATNPIIIGYDQNAGSNGAVYASPPILGIWTQVGGQWTALDVGPYDPVQKKRTRVYGEWWGLNNRCEMTGDFRDADGNSLGNLWQNGHIVDLGPRTSGDFNDFYPRWINNNGAILAYAANTSDGSDANVLLLPAQPAASVIYMFSGHDSDTVTLDVADIPGVEYRWKLKNSDGAQGKFQNDQETNWSDTGTASTVTFRAGKDGGGNIAGDIRAQASGTNTIQLLINGTVCWEKPLEVIQIVSRIECGAEAADVAHMDGVMRNPPQTGAPLTSILGLTYHHSGNTNDGVAEIQRIQKEHKAEGFPYNLPNNLGGHPNWGDIGYHFVMAKDGTIYEGRQLEAAPGSPGGPYTLGADVYGKNTPAGIGICMLGNYDTDVFTAAHQTDLEKVITAICRRYNLTPDKITYHKALRNTPPVVSKKDTNCPGANVIHKADEIRTHVGQNLQ